jgi:hypothetical protein
MVVGFEISQQLATSSLIFMVFFEKTSEAFALPETNQEFSLLPSNCSDSSQTSITGFSSQLSYQIFRTPSNIRVLNCNHLTEDFRKTLESHHAVSFKTSETRTSESQNAITSKTSKLPRKSESHVSSETSELSDAASQGQKICYLPILTNVQSRLKHPSCILASAAITAPIIRATNPFGRGVGSSIHQQPAVVFK